ncbi:MAG: hypothetical protein ACF8NJ_05930 [Phycisphaerales bacterium JB038]
MTRPWGPQQERFAVEGDYLVHYVTPTRGKPYVHRCEKASYELLAHVAEEIGDEGFTLETLVEQADVPFSQAAVALAFWKERGILEPGHPRRNYPMSEDLHLDAMIEYHALLEEGPDSGSG